MKTKLIFSFALISTVLALFLGSKSGEIIEHQSPSAQSVYTNVSDSFIIGAMDMGGSSGYEYYHPPFGQYNSHFNYYQQYDSMNFNLWHKYTIKQGQFNRALPYGWWETMHRDSLYAHIDVYRPGTYQVLDSNRGRNMKTLMLRPKIEWLCFGQRSDYQCEKIPRDSGDFWFYAYDTSITNNNNIYDITDTTIYGNGARAKYCQYNSSNPGQDSGYVVKNLRSNREQVNPIEAWQGDRQCPWLIKPRIRIDSNEVDNNPNKKVCRIDIYNYYGDINDSNRIQSADIYVRDFDFLRIHNYNGKYLEEYFFSPSQADSAIKIDTGIAFNRYKEEYFWTNNCKVDFRVFWYGLCDMWIDYVRVDNDVADRLLNFEGDNVYEQWLQWEATDIARHGTSPFKFYIEEFEFNNLSCIKYVNKKLRSYNDNISLMANINFGLINAHLPFGSYPGFDNLKIKAGYISRYIIDSAKLKELFISNYPIRGESGVSKIPNTLDSYFSGAGYDPTNGILADYASPNAYDNWLQDYLDAGEGVKTFKIVDTISRISQIPSIQLIQSHLSYEPAIRFREPTIQEQEVLVDLGICYGGRGIMYFTYGGVNKLPVPNGETPKYFRGFCNPLDTNTLLTYYTPRYVNVYGQQKWNSLKKLNAKLKKWGPYIMSFDNASRRSYILRLERNNLIDETFFNDVISYKADNTDYTIPSSTFEPVSQRYLQCGVFNNPSEQYTRYFMIVNRRCSPYVDSTTDDKRGGRRFVRVRFDANASAFAGFNNWEIIDLEKDSSVMTFDKQTSSLLDLGWYDPGVGKLYKIAPVMQEGGTLVTNEDCSGQFDCKGEINNNGYDINIRPGATINFTNSSARIIMTEGDFKSGIIPTDNTAPVYLKGKNGNFWKGLQFQN